jgi:hypothetical protein
MGKYHDLNEIYGKCLKATHTENRSMKAENPSYVVFYPHEKDSGGLPTLKIKSNFKIWSMATRYNANFHHVGINSSANLENRLDNNQKSIISVLQHYKWGLGE